jgi:serine/threonine protein kinase
MGRVYEALDLESGRRVALKVITARDPISVVRFADEVAILEALKHPAIVGHVAHGIAGDGLPYLAMDWLAGESLAARLARGPISAGDTLLLGRRIADALAAAHARSIVHRDLKPSNILLVHGRPDAAVLIDFGIARRLGRDLTGKGILVGTPGFMAPEQALSSRSVDGRADLFGLGCVLYSCLTNRRAFDGKDTNDVLDQLVHVSPPAMSAFVPHLPPQLDALIRRLIAKNPAARPASAAEVAGELARIADEEAWSPRARKVGRECGCHAAML